MQHINKTPLANTCATVYNEDWVVAAPSSINDISQWNTAFKSSKFMCRVLCLIIIHSNRKRIRIAWENL